MFKTITDYPQYNTTTEYEYYNIENKTNKY